MHRSLQQLMPLLQHIPCTPQVQLIERVSQLPSPPGSLPSWLQCLTRSLESPTTPRYARIFLVKAILHVELRSEAKAGSSSQGSQTQGAPNGSQAGAGEPRSPVRGTAAAGGGGMGSVIQQASQAPARPSIFNAYAPCAWCALVLCAIALEQQEHWAVERFARQRPLLHVACTIHAWSHSSMCTCILAV